MKLNDTAQMLELDAKSVDSEIRLSFRSSGILLVGL